MPFLTNFFKTLPVAQKFRPNRDFLVGRAQKIILVDLKKGRQTVENPPPRENPRSDPDLFYPFCEAFHYKTTV